MKKLITRWKWIGYLEGVILLALGVILAVCSWLNGFSIALGYIAAAFLLANGLFLLIMEIVNKDASIDSGFAISAVTIALSVLLFVLPQLLFNYLPILVGSALIVLAIYEVVIAVERVKTKAKASLTLSAFAVFALSLTFGVLFLYYGIGVIKGFVTDGWAAQLIVCLIGVGCIYAGIVIIVGLAVAQHRVNKVKRAVKTLEKVDK